MSRRYLTPYASKFCLQSDMAKIMKQWKKCLKNTTRLNKLARNESTENWRLDSSRTNKQLKDDPPTWRYQHLSNSVSILFKHILSIFLVDVKVAESDWFRYTWEQTPTRIAGIGLSGKSDYWLQFGTVCHSDVGISVVRSDWLLCWQTTTTTTPPILASE